MLRIWQCIDYYLQLYTSTSDVVYTCSAHVAHVQPSAWLCNARGHGNTVQESLIAWVSLQESLPGTAEGCMKEQEQAQRRAAFNAALECVAELVTRCPSNCKAAVDHSIIPILTSYLSKNQNPPPNPAALRTLYQLVSCVEHRQDIFDGIMSCLTIPALARLLDTSLVLAGPAHCSKPPVAFCCHASALHAQLIIQPSMFALFHTIYCTRIRHAA
jgi:hypothetical protein